MTGVHIGEDGFSCHAICYALRATVRDIFAGAATGPKTIQETLNEARAAAMAIDNYFKQRLNDRFRI